MAEVLEVQIQDKGGSGGSGPPQGPGGGLGGPPQVLGTLNAQLTTLQTISGQLAGKGPQGPSKPGGPAVNSKKAPPAPSLTGGLAKLGVSKPGEMVSDAGRLAQGGEELAGALGASAEAAAAFGAATAGVGLAVGAVAAGLWIDYKAMQTAWHLATERVELFGLKVASSTEEIKNLSPQLSLAKAKADIVSFLDDFREAQGTGEDLARIAESQSNIQHELREAFLPIRQFLLGYVADVLKIFEEFMPEVKATLGATLEVMKTSVQITQDAFGDGHLRDIPAHMDEMWVNIRKAIERAHQKRSEDKVETDIFLRYLDQIAAPLSTPNANMQAADTRPNIPVVAGLGGP